MPSGLIATAAVGDLVRRGLTTFHWPHLAVGLVDASLFGRSREDIAALAAPAARTVVDGLLDGGSGGGSG